MGGDWDVGSVLGHRSGALGHGKDALGKRSARGFGMYLNGGRHRDLGCTGTHGGGLHWEKRVH